MLLKSLSLKNQSAPDKPDNHAFCRETESANNKMNDLQRRAENVLVGLYLTLLTAFNRRAVSPTQNQWTHKRKALEAKNRRRMEAESKNTTL